ncbi:hypothetical protein [Methanosphaera sp.]|uniref:hypothetical protein n=1 Tax=Methanosphaera sp. TaxID=2666342 RepID=UPI0025E41E48|nr:hypothetical protein [Methanosphaera sp.]
MKACQAILMKGKHMTKFKIFISFAVSVLSTIAIAKGISINRAIQAHNLNNEFESSLCIGEDIRKNKPANITGIENLEPLSLGGITTDLNIFGNHRGQSKKEIFQNALQTFKSDFSKYIDVTGLNVSDKSLINLPGYNPNYIAPTFGEVAYAYHTNMIRAFRRTFNYSTYCEVVRDSYSVDRFASLAEVKYENLNPTLHFEMHEAMTRSIVDPSAIGTLTLIISSLSAPVAAGFTAAIGLLEAAVASAWFPYVMAALIVAALILIAVLIVTHWDEICERFLEFRRWVKQYFSEFADVFEDYFTETEIIIQDSLTSYTKTLFRARLVFTEVKSNDVATTAAIVNEAKTHNKIYLMEYVSKSSFYIARNLPVSESFCIEHKTHLHYSSYTWEEQLARRLIILAGTGYTTPTPELDHSDDENVVLWWHYHNYSLRNGELVRPKDRDLHRIHSFFGPMYYYPDDGSDEPIEHPNNPAF